MKADALAFVPGLHSACEELAAQRARFEVFARVGESRRVRWCGGEWERRVTREIGIACRVARGGMAGFAAAAGSGPASGREVARCALANMLPARDPLPPAARLGVAAAGGASVPVHADELDPLALAIVAAAERAKGIRLLEVRLLAGGATSALVTGEAFAAKGSAAGAVIEMVTAASRGPVRRFAAAVRCLDDVDAQEFARRACEITRALASGPALERQLADVVLAPPVAALLVAAVAERLRPTQPNETREAAHVPRVAPVWHLVDERVGPAGLMPMPFDGEGFAARRIVLLAGGRVREAFASWDEARDGDAVPGGTVRTTYRQPPAGGPANLVVATPRPLSLPALLARLDCGFHALLPAGDLHLDETSGRFALPVAAVSVAGGKTVVAHPLVELRGSLRRLLSGLAAVGDDPASFSLTCAVTTPSLLFHKLELA